MTVPRNFRLPGQPGKYGAKRAYSALCGRTFASQAEARRGEELALLQRAGQIRNLAYQPRYPLRVRDVLVCTYVADFSYLDGQGVLHVEDVKGAKTQTYRIKAKLMLAVWGITVEEVQA